MAPNNGNEEATAGQTGDQALEGGFEWAPAAAFEESPSSIMNIKEGSEKKEIKFEFGPMNFTNASIEIITKPIEKPAISWWDIGSWWYNKTVQSMSGEPFYYNSTTTYSYFSNSTSLDQNVTVSDLTLEQYNYFLTQDYQCEV